MQPTPSTPTKSFSDSIDRGPDWLQNWKAAPSALNGFSNDQLDNYMQASMGDGQTIAGDNAGGSAGGKGIRGIIPFSQATGLPLNTQASVDGMPSNRQYTIAANFEINDAGVRSGIPAYYTALNTSTNQIDYVIGQTDLPKFMSDPFSNRVKAWADNQSAYARDAGNALTNLATGSVDGDGARIQQGAGQLVQSWKEALTSPDYLMTTALSWTGGVLAKESIMTAQELQSGKYTTLYRGDAAPQSQFLSKLAQNQGIETSNAAIANAEGQGSVSYLFENHALNSGQSPYISLTTSREVAESFARGVDGTQTGYVTKFKLPTNFAEPNFENLNSWEREYLAPTQINKSSIVNQYQVKPKKP